MKMNATNKVSEHRNIWMSSLFLCVLGLLMIYSASGSMALFKRQLIFIVAGFIACAIVQLFHYQILYKYAGAIYLISIICIFLLLSPAGVSVNGATRWLRIAGIQFQVAEIVKIGVIILLSYFLQRQRMNRDKIQLVILLWLFGGFAAGLLLIISNDLSSSLVVLGITFLMTFIFTEFFWLHVGVFVFGCTVVGIYVYSIWKNLPTVAELENMSFRVGRIAAWLSPYKYESDQSYQTLQALYAIGRGGLFGKGLGNSLQKFMIPEPHTDMIFSILCEELGVLGVGVLFSLLSYLLLYLVRTAKNTNDVFGSAIVVGVACHIAVQSFINLAVNVNVFPNTGIALPFISYGGTAAFTLLCEIAMTLSVARSSEGLFCFKNKIKRKKTGRRKS